MEEGEGAVVILVDADVGLDEVAAMALLRDLQDAAIEADAIVVADDTLVFGAKDVAQFADERHEGVALFGRRHGEAGIVLADIGLGQIAVGGFDGGDPLEPEGRRQALLQGAEQPLHAAAAFGTVGGDVLDPELGQRPADLGRLVLVDFAAGLGRDEVVAAAVGIEG